MARLASCVSKAPQPSRSAAPASACSLGSPAKLWPVVLALAVPFAQAGVDQGAVCRVWMRQRGPGARASRSSPVSSVACIASASAT